MALVFKGDKVVLVSRQQGDPPEGSNGTVEYVGLGGLIRVNFTIGCTRVLHPDQIKRLED